MAEGIVYLDVDDEITSAASRIRSAPGTKVALVVPNGSRIATSRINFRLLSREALVSNRRLSVIAGDPASRALAASAGLPVFATVAEYEAALAGPKPPIDDDRERAAQVPDVPAAAPGPVAIVAAPEPEPPRRPRRGSAPDATAAVASDETRRILTPVAPTVPTADAGGRDRRDDALRVAKGSSRVRAPVVAAIAAIALAVIAGGVAAYLFLPSATIAVTPHQESIEIPLTIAADPTVTEVDAANSVVPAIRLEVPVQASKTFTTTGRHVELSSASGSVTFTNYNTGSSNTIAAGSVVSTEGGVRFRTDVAVTLPPAKPFPVFVPSARSVAISAVKQGPAGNVPANAIRVVPQGENPDLLHVNNPDPTAGGSRTETPEIAKAEVDKAVAELRKTLQASFTDAIDAGAGAPAGTELFPTTATLGTAAFKVDPATLIGRAVETFDLEVSATGSVTAVDPTPIRSIAEARLRYRIGADHRLVDGSLDIKVGNGTVGEDGQVTFLATARAARVIVVDPNQLRTLVKGRTIADAEAALAPYGEATVSLWPSWVTTVTGIDARLSIKIDEGAGQPSTSPSATPSKPAASQSSAGKSAQPSRATGSAAP